jgi:hypothetical protein
MSACPPFHVSTFDAAPIDGSFAASQEPLFAIPEYDFGHATTPPSAAADPVRGSFEWDLQRNYKLRWESLDTMWV